MMMVCNDDADDADDDDDDDNDTIVDDKNYEDTRMTTHPFGTTPTHDDSCQITLWQLDNVMEQIDD